MKTVFVVNPKAGQGKHGDETIEKIKRGAADLNVDVQVYITKGIGDGERFVKEYCQTFGAARFIACGGDGTLSEVLNGAIDCAGAEIGVMPMGTGNDFCRNFQDAGDFLDVSSQLRGESILCDAIRYQTTLAGETKSGYCVNMFNIGFDCNVADMTAEMKKKPLVSGSFAYILSIFANLIRKKGANLRIEVDGKEAHNGQLLLTSVANGSYCGGGIKSNPLASVSDGFLSVNIIKNISRLYFLRLLPLYMKGTFLNFPGIERVILSKRCKKLTITPLAGAFRICCDGEITDAGKTEFEIVPGAFRFVVPKG